MGLWPQGSAPTRMMWPLPMRGDSRTCQVSREPGLGHTSWEGLSARYTPLHRQPGPLGSFKYLGPNLCGHKALKFAEVTDFEMCDLERVNAGSES